MKFTKPQELPAEERAMAAIITAITGRKQSPRDLDITLQSTGIVRVFCSAGLNIKKTIPRDKNRSDLAREGTQHLRSFAQRRETWAHQLQNALPPIQHIPILRGTLEATGEL